MSEDIERFSFNTYISNLMIFVNGLSDYLRTGKERDAVAISEALETLILLLSPAAPHSADELWEAIGRDGFTYEAQWPKWDPEVAASETITIAVQVNGKLRDTLSVVASATKEDLEQAALASEKAQAHLAGQQIRKVIVVPGRLVNIVAG